MKEENRDGGEVGSINFLSSFSEPHNQPEIMGGGIARQTGGKKGLRSVSAVVLLITLFFTADAYIHTYFDPVTSLSLKGPSIQQYQSQGEGKKR